MATLIQFIETYGLWVVFVSVLIDQGGTPISAYPAIILTAALAVRDHRPLWPILLVAIVATVLADLFWYIGGRKFGGVLLRLVCRISLSPDSCVRRTRRTYGRWGPPSLMVAKYVPGFAAVVTTLAGETGTAMRRFIFYDGIGAALWASGAVALGAIFHTAVGAVLHELDRFGRYAFVVIGAAVLLFLAVKSWQRERFLTKIRMARITIDELTDLLDSELNVAVLDVRLPESRARNGWIPGSVQLQDVADLDLSPDDEVIIYCDCPNEASAAVAARKLQDEGYSRVRPLAGGLDAWHARGLPVERQRTAA